MNGYAANLLPSQYAQGRNANTARALQEADARYGTTLVRHLEDVAPMAWYLDQLGDA